MTMKVFVAGATGAIGRQLVPRLVAAGHEVHGMTRSAAKQQLRPSHGLLWWDPRVGAFGPGPAADHLERTSRVIAAAEDAADTRRRLGASGGQGFPRARESGRLDP